MMLCPPEERLKLIEHLTHELAEGKKERKHYQYLYKEQCVQNKNIQKKLVALKKKVSKLDSELSAMQSKVGVHIPKYSGDRSKRKCKAWCRLRCEKSKRVHISEYRQHVFSTIQENVPHCKRAHLSLCLTGQNVNFNWNGEQLKKVHTPHEAPTNFGSRDDHLYAKPEHPEINEHDHDEEITDVDYSKIFDCEGNWQRNHKRSIIHILDTFRISHQAYHELRHAGKNHFPPLHHIIKEKIVMSDEIPYTKHDTVSINYTSVINKFVAK